MTPDEIETRITRLETQCTALTVLVHCVLPATVPDRRHLVLQQFGQYSMGMQKTLEANKTAPHLVKFQLQELVKIYTSVQEALEMIAKHEAKKGA